MLKGKGGAPRDWEIECLSRMDDPLNIGRVRSWQRVVTI
jgi:hypothetical protein